MQPAGWYPDPSGQPNSFRFWDGQTWTQVTTTDPRSSWPQPDQLGVPPQQQGPGGPGVQQPGTPQQPGFQQPGTPQQPGSQPLGAPGTQPLGRPGSQPLGSGQTGSTTPGSATPGSAIPGSTSGTVPGEQAPSGGSRMGLVIGAAVLVLALLAGGIWYATSGGSSEPQPNPTQPPLPTNTGGGTPSGGPTPGGDGQLNCSAGNGNQTRTKQPSYASTGVVYDAVPDWGFAYNRSYWTYLDDYSAMGAIRIDGDKDNNAGIALGGLSHTAGFSDQAKAGEQVLQCYEGALASEGKVTHTDITRDEMSMGGMKTQHSHTTLSGPGVGAKPLVVDIYVIDSAQPGKWAMMFTLQTENSSAAAKIQQAVGSVRHS